MKAHTSNFKDAIKQFGKQIDSIIKYGEIELGAEDLNSITPNYEGDLLKSSMKSLIIDSNIEIPVNTIVNYKFGVKIKDDEVEDFRENYEYLNFGDYIVKEVNKKEDTGSYEIKCYDFMLRSMTEYHELEIGAFPMTVRQYITNLCNQLSLEFANENMSFVNSDRTIYSDVYKEIGYTYRDIFDDLAEVTGSTIVINKDNKVEIRYINNTQDEINEEYLKSVNVNFGEKYGPINSIVLSRSAGSDNVYIKDDASIDNFGLCELKINDNQIMNNNDRSDYLPELFEQLNGIEYFINDFVSTGICYYDICDRYNVKIDNNIYSCVMFNDEINVTQGLEENIHTDMPTTSETEYKYADTTDKRINQTYLIVDKQNQKIEATIDKVDGQEQKFTKINADIDGLRAQIGKVADITITSEGVGTILLENILSSEAIYLQIHPTIKDINYLIVGRTIVGESALLTTPTIYFEQVVDDGDNVITKHLLPKPLYIYDSETYDEYIIDYENTRRYIIHRVGIENGVKYKLTNPYEEDLEYESYKFEEDGSYRIYFKGFPSAYIKCRAMVSNIYTSQYATRVELNSSISQSATEIYSTVSEKYFTKDGANELSSRITQNVNSISSEISRAINNENVLGSRITQTEDSIANEVRRASNSEGELSSRITQTESSIIEQVGQQITNLDGKIETVSGEVSLKIDKDDNNQIVSMINASADKINIVSNNTIIKSNGYSLENGKLSITDVSNGRGGDLTIQNATIDEIYSSWDNIMHLVMPSMSRITVPTFGFYNIKGNTETFYISRLYSNKLQTNEAGIDRLSANNSYISNLYFQNGKGSNLTIYGTFSNLSQEKYKKNFEKLENALDIVNDIDIYKYNLKSEQDDIKKHIGFVIGNNYKYSKDITSNNNDGVDLYSFVSVCCKAIKEQQKQIEELKKEIQILKEMK